MCKVYTGYCGTSEIEHGLCSCRVDKPLDKARGLSLRTGAQTMVYLSHVKLKFNNISSGEIIMNSLEFFFSQILSISAENNHTMQNDILAI